MNRKTLVLCLKVIEIFIILASILLFVGMIPEIINGMAEDFPEFKYLATPSIIIINLSAIPLFIVLISIWKISTNISKEKSFSDSTAKQLLIIGICAFIDTIYYFIFSIFLYVSSAINPGVMIILFVIITFGLAITIISLILNRLIIKAAHMEEEINYTI